MPLARPATARLAAILCATIGLTGCTTEQGGTTGDVARAAESAASATASGELTLELYASGRSSRALTETSLTALIDISQAAEIALATRVTETAENQHLRQDVLEQVREGTDALVAARAWLTTDAGEAAVIIEDLGEASATLTETSQEWKP